MNGAANPRWRSKTRNDRALYLLVKDVVRTEPSIDWGNAAKERAAKAGLVYTGDTINRCIDSAAEVLHQERIRHGKK